MTPNGDKPMTGNTARTLGVRPGNDIPVDDHGNVAPGTGGMSVAPSWKNLPTHRIPERLKHVVEDACGNPKDRCWRMGEGPFVAGPAADGLVLVPDKPVHGVVEPAVEMTLGELQAKLAATQAHWVIDEEE